MEKIRWTSLRENPELLKEIEDIKNRLNEVTEPSQERHLADSACLLGFISDDLDKISKKAFIKHREQMFVKD